MTKTIHRVGGNVDHEYKVLANGRVVRCSKLCGDPDELLIEAYEDVLRANPHLIEELRDLTKLLRTNPDQGAKAAAELERRLIRLRGTERGPGVAVGRAEDIGGRIHETTRGRAGIPGDEGRAARAQLRANLGAPPQGGGVYQAHHIVPFEVRNHPLVDRMRVQFNWNINGRRNGIYLPSNVGVDITGLTVHRGSHMSYSQWVESRLDDLAARYKAGAVPEARLQREFEDLIGEFENALRRSAFGRRQPGGEVIVR